MRIEVIGDATLYLGDCLSIIPTLQPVVSVLCDPPYGIDYKSGHMTETLWADNHIKNDKTTFVRDSALQMVGNIPCVIFGSQKAQKPDNTRMILIWDKGRALGMGALDLPWKPSTEEIYILGRGYVGERDEGAVLYCPPVQSMAKNGRVHPNQKPIQLLVRLLKKMPVGIVLDFAMGSGSTGVACAKLGRKFIGIELDERYFDIACKRIEEAYRQPDFFVEPPSKPKQETLEV